MKASSLLIAVFCCAGALTGRADQTVASVQQALKDQGFYYGEITGTKDADTTAAIRRYQIRNGLKITGELSSETEKSLGLHGATAAPSATPARPPARTTPPPPTPPDASELRDDRTVAPDPQPQPQVRDFTRESSDDDYAPGPHGLYPATTGRFDGTPFEVAPLDVQRQAVMGAQSRLAQQGYYRGPIDGAFGPGTVSALRTFQTRFALPPSGRLDMETLAALGLLPGQRGPGIDAPRRRVYRSRRVLPGPGERVYIPR